MVYLQMTGSQRESDSLSPSLDFIVAVKVHANWLTARCLCRQTVLTRQFLSLLQYWQEPQGEVAKGWTNSKSGSHISSIVDL